MTSNHTKDRAQPLGHGPAHSQSQAKDDLRLQANLQVLKRKDPLVSHIVDSTPHVTLYRYMTPTPGSDSPAGWTRDGIEGTMFLFARSARPTHGIFIMNRLSTSNYYLPLTSDLVWHVSGDYLMFKAQDKNTYGIWFFEQADRRKFFDVITQLCKQEDTNNNTRSANATSTTKPAAGGTSSAKLLASAQNDLMGMIQRARGSSGDPGASSINSVTSSNAPSATVSAGDSDMARLMAKLSTASPAPGPVPLDASVTSPPRSAAPIRPSSPARTKSPTKKPTPAAPASPTKPTANPAATLASSPIKPTSTTPAAPAQVPSNAAQEVDPIRLAHATMSLMHAFPPGLPSRQALRDSLIARVTNDSMFLDAVWATYAQMSAAAAAAAAATPGMGMGLPGAPPLGMPPGMSMGLGANMGMGMGMRPSQAMSPGLGFGPTVPPQGMPPVNGQPPVSPASMALGMGGMPPAVAPLGSLGPMALGGQRPAPPASMFQGQQQQQQQQMRGQGMPMSGGGYTQHPR
ncbi:hypothetical protein BCR44DRAFT_33981 [Catenaria anguillulae PL171]|uniref:Dcp1-like decapping family-domain-containing protein n=1 Tax=Catenaria anguillulae PL171 TaxID=765915 RepID=A0A1Y2HUB4_9FUNG|nr:hypothetical protein BCR44DRAFT_33981 [Catenaria anguillulae PL171]